jgi:iron complex transport system substrate-binding protein
MSTTHVAFISALGEAATISAVSGLKHVSDTAVRAQAAAGVTVDVGYDASVSYELIFALKPDVVFAYGVTGEFTVVEKKLNELGIKVVYIGEYLEEQPLGKAEWLLAMSAFFDRETQAVAAFDTVEARYLAAAAMVKNVAHKPLVMLNVPYKDVWYLPGTRNYTVRFIEDAGAEYIYPSHRQRETYPMSIENAFVLAQKADFWLLGNWAKSLGDLKANDPRMAEIPAFKKGKVYNSNLRMNSDGGDDFWESGIVQPDVILNDMIKIFHPELLPEHELYFYRHLE